MYELENDDEIEIDLRELFLALKKKIVWILLTAIVFAGASGLITKFAMTPIYSSSMPKTIPLNQSRSHHHSLIRT